jgi:putative heme iron utilization protein
MTSSNNFHSGGGPSQEYLYDIDVATPSHAERARTMASLSVTGTLSTLAHAESGQAGYPYGSLVTTGLHEGQPIFLISGLAEHTHNLRADARASLLLTERGDETPLALGRVTLLGDCVELGEDELAGPRESYLAAAPEAAYYMNYGDFSFWRLKVQSLRYIGGFGRMSWVTAGDWFAAEPDPLAADAKAIIAHMNDDHVEAMTAYCHAFTRAQEFSAVQMTGVDRYGFEMSVETADGWRPIRLAFEHSCDTPQLVRAALVELVAKARAK